MGRKIRDLSGETQIPDAPSVREALLFTTMSIIGLLVEVQVKDGSIYSGIFRTACFEKDYGIVLKKAKMTKKGKKDANLENGDAVDTLVVHSSDLVQVIAKGHLLLADGIVGTVSNEDVETVNGSFQRLEYSESEMNKLKSSQDAPHNLIAEANHINGTSAKGTSLLLYEGRYLLKQWMTCLRCHYFAGRENCTVAMAASLKEMTD